MRHPDRNLRAIERSLERFGQQKPIVVDRAGIVRAGNGTLAAARSLGWTEILVRWTELEGNEAAAYAIADNRAGELAEWDADRLPVALASLKSAGIELKDVGFSDREISRFAGRLREESASKRNPKLQAFIAAKKKSEDRFRDKSETNFWLCLVFQSCGQKREFLTQFPDTPIVYEQYLDGQAFASAVGIPLHQQAEAPFQSPLDQRLSERVLARTAE